MPERITFTDRRQPALPAGEYTITVRQTTDIDPAEYTTSRRFTVGSDRFTLPPGEVRATFPPDGSVGEHLDVLPHLALSRPTLPWERTPSGADDTAPWLVLLLFAGDERPTPKVVRAADLAADDVHPPPVTLEPHESPDDPVTVIDVPRHRLVALLPHYDELRYLAHVRGGDAGANTAVLVGNRLAPAGRSCVVHLVSVEGRYHGTPGNRTFDFGADPDPDRAVRLVTLASWQFACVDAEQTFAHQVRGLAHAGARFRLPATGNLLADRYLAAGFVPARHRLRTGGHTLSWYRGPLLDRAAEDTPVAPARTADGLLRYHPAVGMLDVSYAAAWQLGRLLTLQTAGVAAELYALKRRRSQLRKRTARAVAGYPLTTPDIDDAWPPKVLAWLSGLATLAGVPVAYLVPDARLLPVETLRFVALDRRWARHLVDGANSIGRLDAADAELDAAEPPPVEYPTITGVLLRSSVVGGYPGLLVDGYADAAARTPLAPARTIDLSTDMRLYLFHGTLARLDLHQAPGLQHFGVELLAPTTPGGPATIQKVLRGPDDDALDDPIVTEPLAVDPTGRVPIGMLTVAMAQALGSAPAAFTAADFSREMMVTAERVRFLTGLD